MPRIQGHSPAGRCLGVLLVYGVRGSRGDVHDSPMIVLDGLLDGLLRRLKVDRRQNEFNRATIHRDFRLFHRVRVLFDADTRTGRSAAAAIRRPPAQVGSFR